LLLSDELIDRVRVFKRIYVSRVRVDVRT
jgi:hypothetical protein